MISVSVPARLCSAARLTDIASGAKFRRHLILACALSLGSFAAVRAHPMDSPDTIYIDGVPCNAACQSYMAWSRKTLQQNSESPHAVANRKLGKTRLTSVVAKHSASRASTRGATPVPREAPRNLPAGLEYLVPVPDDHSLPVQAAPEAKSAAPEIKAAPETKTAALENPVAAPQVETAPPASASDKTIE